MGVNAARSTPTRAPNSPEFDRLVERPVNELETERAPACPGLELNSRDNNQTAFSSIFKLACSRFGGHRFCLVLR